MRSFCKTVDIYDSLQYFIFVLYHHCAKLISSVIHSEKQLHTFACLLGIPLLLYMTIIDYVFVITIDDMAGFLIN